MSRPAEAVRTSTRPAEPDGSASPDLHHIYLAWNTALGEHFFNPQMAGRRVVLSVSDDLLKGLGERAGLNPGSFVPAVKAGVPWGERSGTCYRALDAFDAWRDKELDFPPYLGALCTFVLAVGIEAPEWRAFAYYPRLRRILGEDEDAGQPNGFRRMDSLWDDLEVWSNRDKHGQLGNFEVLFAGEQVHVAIPKGQALLTEHERVSLPPIFDEEQLDPASNPPDAQLLRALVRRGPGRLRPRTIGLARGGDDDELRNALAETVAEELRDWNGALDPGDGRPGRITGGLRLQLDLDDIAGHARTSLRCVVSAATAFPDAGFLLGGPPFAGNLIALEHAPSWSSVLSHEATGLTADASAIDWASGTQLIAEGHGAFRMRGTELRVFVSGLDFGLPALIEVGSVPDAGECVFACTTRIEEKVVAWLEQACEASARIAVSRGLPEGWRLWRAQGLGSGYATAPFDALLRNTALRIGLEGGLRASRGNEYFAFALPTVVFPDLADLEISCDGGSLAPVSAGRYRLTATETGDCIVTITVTRGPSRRRLDIHVIQSYSWAFGPGEEGLNTFGEGVSAGAAVTGVLVSGEADTALAFEPRPESALGDLRQFRNLSFIGRRRDEFSRWPQQPVPTTWRPVWAVEMRRRGRLVYVGLDPQNEEPQAASERGVGVATWQEFLLRNGRRIAPPSDARLSRLWRAYLTAARK